MSPLRFSPRTALGALAVAAFALPSAAQAAYVRGEQVDRGDGSGGVTGWSAYLPAVDQYAFAQGKPFAVTDDGRYAFLTYPTSDTSRGLFRRDVLQNTSRLVLDGVEPTGATSSRAQLSVLTKRQLAASDANTGYDLYLVDAFTGAATLASVDTAGAALGDVTAGAITADGTAVVYSRPGGTFRRVLAGSAAASISARALKPGATNLSQEVLSVDGRTALVTSDCIATPVGDVSIVESVQTYSGVLLSANGSVATRVVADAGAPNGYAIRVYDLSTGARRAVRPAIPAEAVYTDVVAVSADGTTATMGAGFPTPGSGKIPASANYVLGTVDLATGAVAKTSGDLAAHYPTLLSPNGRFGIAWDAGHVWVVPTVAGATLPGGTDGAAALAFTSYSSGCTGAQPILQPSGRPSVGLRIGTYSISGFAVPPVSLAVRAIVVANGAVMNAFTLTPASNSRSINGYFGAITLDVVARFPGGTTSTGRGSVPAYSPPTCPPLIL